MNPLRWLLHQFESEEQSLEEIQARLRVAPIVRKSSPCENCHALVSGAHDCEGLTPSERYLLLRFLIVRLSLRAERKTSEVKAGEVRKFEPRRASGGRVR